MKNIVLLIIFTIFFANAKQVENSEARHIYMENLNIVKQSVNNKEGLMLKKVSSAIDFFERLTLIKSESKGDFIGRYRPTKNDLINWKRWYKSNKEKLFWDKTKKQVFVSG